MNAYFFLVLALVLPNTYLAREVGPQEESALYKDTFVFPKDRKSSLNARIIGGEEVVPHSYPFQAALFIYTPTSIIFCAGTLISPSWVLTAAHCLSTNPSYILVQLGVHDLTTIESSSVLLNSTRSIYHQDWNGNTHQNDVGLVKLTINVPLNDNIKTVSLARGNQSYAQEVSTTIGWGETEIGISIVPTLRSVNATILSNAACAAEDPVLDALIIPSHLCISGEGIRGACAGDSGGPLLVNGVQVGITSFGFSNCLLGKPTVFTRVTDFYDWIVENTNE